MSSTYDFPLEDCTFGPATEKPMTPTEKHEAASDALRQHELSHIRIQREYEASYAKLKILNRAASEAWREMIYSLEAASREGP